MWMVIGVGSLTLVVCLAIQLLGLIWIIRYLSRRVSSEHHGLGLYNEFQSIAAVALAAFIGHLVQAAIWAGLFLQLGEFDDFAHAYYHSMVNFTSLGYGDIVMSEQWRLLGAMEAANGVLMFGITTGALLSVMNLVFQKHQSFRNVHRILHPESREHGGKD